MKYVLVFQPFTAGYRCHAEGCSAATTQTMTKANRYAFPEKFDSIDAAREVADADESEKAGTATKANFRVCKCAKARE